MRAVLCLIITLVPRALCFVFDYYVSTSRTLFNKLMLVFYASVLLLIMNFDITLSK